MIVELASGEMERRAPDLSRWLCVVCKQPSKRAHTEADRLCMICIAPGPEAPTAPKPVRRRRRAFKGRRRK